MLIESEGFVRMVLHLGWGERMDLTEMRGSRADELKEKTIWRLVAAQYVCS